MRAEAIAVEPETGAFARRTARDFCSVSTHWLAFENVAVQYRPVGNQGAPKGVAVRRRRSLLDQGVPDCYQKSSRCSPPAWPDS